MFSGVLPGTAKMWTGTADNNYQTFREIYREWCGSNSRPAKGAGGAAACKMDGDDLILLYVLVRCTQMREGIHPKYYETKVTCNCGNEFVTGSTVPEIHVEICSKCHSFYTGQQKAAQARGRIDKFNRKYGFVQNN